MKQGNGRKRTRRKFTGEFKAKVALEAIKAQETINQIAARHEVHPHQVTQWKQQLLRQAPAAFEQPAALQQQDGVEEELYGQIGRLKMELEWLKKKLGPYLPGGASGYDR
jgi:transposase-like protein